ncbi:MAG: hypothetical protein IPM29_21425 [Planctomycetes bacterium]|nr:hypothetical protein [Planctomycetota bacterium]
MTHPKIRTTLARTAVASLALLAAACSGGSAGTTPDSRSGAGLLLVDTAAGSDDVITVQVLAVVAERADGQLSGNLLAQPATLVLTDPRGATAGLPLAALPADGPQVGLRILVDGAATRAARTDGSRVVVRLPGTELRLVADQPFSAGDGRALEITHATPPQRSVAPDGSLDVRLDLALHARDDAAVRALTARVAAVDLAARTVAAVLPAFGDRAVELAFDDQSRLFDDNGAARGVDDFLRQCGSDSELRIDGIRSGDDRVACRSAEHQQRGRGSEPQYTGRLASLDAGAQTFVLDAFLRRGADGRELPFAGTLTVDASAATIRRSLGGGAHAPASFAELAVGGLVEVEGQQDARGVLVAREVDIEDESGQHAGGEIEGAVTAVDLATRTIVVGPRRDDPLLLAGQRVDRLEVLVDEATVLFRDDVRATPIGLDEVRTTDRIQVRGSVIGDRRVRATSVRVRDDR